MIGRQQHFVAMIESSSDPFGGHTIDQLSNSIGLTLRQILTEAAPPNNKHNPTFLSVKAERGSLMVDYLKPNARRAQEILWGIVPYAKYHAAQHHDLNPGTNKYEDLVSHVT